MIIYYTGMRLKDDNKAEAIFQATIQLLNQVGFSETSMSKIAKKANVSPSTIYVYFENKEDMIKKLYEHVKKKMTENMFRFNPEEFPLKQGFERMVRNYVDYVLDHKDEFLFTEQFANSPYIKKLDSKETDSFMTPMYALFEKGKDQHVFKQVDTNLLIICSFVPVIHLVKDHINGTFELTPDHLQSLIQMGWDAIQA